MHHAAAFRGAPEIVEALLGGVDPNVRTEYGETPLFVAIDIVSYGDQHSEAYLSAWTNKVRVLLAGGANPLAETRDGRTPWSRVQEIPELDRSDIYWLLNDARFNAPGPGARRAPAAVPGGGTAGDPAGNERAAASGGQCLIPNYPTPPGGVVTLGFSWCPASVGIQRRSFALQAAGAQCAMATGSSSTPDQINARRQEINAACNTLDAWQSPDIPTCQCPAGLRR